MLSKLSKLKYSLKPLLTPLKKLPSLAKKLPTIAQKLNPLRLALSSLPVTKLLPWLNRFGLVRLLAGKHASLAMYVMSLIVDAYEKRTTTRIVKAVYKNMPADWKAPQGPATETELNNAIKQGVLFARSLNALAK